MPCSANSRLHANQIAEFSYITLTVTWWNLCTSWCCAISHRSDISKCGLKKLLLKQRVKQREVAEALLLGEIYIRQSSNQPQKDLLPQLHFHSIDIEKSFSELQIWLEQWKTHSMHKLWPIRLLCSYNSCSVQMKRKVICYQLADISTEYYQGESEEVWTNVAIYSHSLLRIHVIGGQRLVRIASPSLQGGRSNPHQFSPVLNLLLSFSTVLERPPCMHACTSNCSVKIT